MIVREYGSFTLLCDICYEEDPHSFIDFYDAVDYKKENGWKSQKNDNDEWEDVCPKCVKKGKELVWE